MDDMPVEKHTEWEIDRDGKQYRLDEIVVGNFVFPFAVEIRGPKQTTILITDPEFHEGLKKYEQLHLTHIMSIK